MYCILLLCRSAGSRLSATPSTPLQTKSVDIGGIVLTGSATSTPRAGNHIIIVSVRNKLRVSRLNVV